MVGRAHLAAAKWPAVAEGQRNSEAFRHAAYLVRDWGLTEAQEWSILAEWNQHNEPPLGVAEVPKCLKSAVCNGQKPVGAKTAGEAPQVPAQPLPWEPPIPLGQFELPGFRAGGFPSEMGSLYQFCGAVAESYQVVIDLPAMLVLSVGGAALAKRVEVHVRADHREPLNLYTATALTPGSRKSQVFREIYVTVRRNTPA